MLFWLATAEQLEWVTKQGLFLRNSCAAVKTCKGSWNQFLLFCEYRTITLPYTVICLAENEKKKTWSKHMLLTKNSQKITFGFLWPQLHFYTCTTGVPKFSGSVSGRWSKVCKESNKTMFLYRVEYLIDQWTQQWNKHAGIMSFQITHLAFVKMSFPFQTQRSSPQCSFIAIIKNLKKKSKHKRN